MLALLRSACAGTIALSAVPLGAVPAPAPVLVQANWAKPARYSGTCPVTIRFHSRLYGTWETATYHWVRSDGTRSPAATIAFDSLDASHAVTRVVSMEWQIAQPGEYWAAVEILKDAYRQPTPSSAGKALVRIACTSDPCAFDTEVGPSTPQVLTCEERRYEQAENELDKLVAAVRAQLVDAASLAADERERLSLRRRLFEGSQTSWRAYMDAACASAYQEIFPGSMAAAHRAECGARLARERIAELNRTYFATDE